MKRFLRLFDFAVALASLGYGLYARDPWWIAGGLLGLVFAWLNPARRMQGVLRTRLGAGRRLPAGSASYGQSTGALAAQLGVREAHEGSRPALSFAPRWPVAPNPVRWHVVKAAHNQLMLLAPVEPRASASPTPSAS